MLNFPLPDLLDEKPFHRRYDEAAQKLANVVDDEECLPVRKPFSRKILEVPQMFISFGSKVCWKKSCSWYSLQNKDDQNYHKRCNFSVFFFLIMFREIHGVNISLLDFEGLWFGRPGCQWIDQFKRAPEPALFQQCHTVNLDWLLILYYR